MRRPRPLLALAERALAALDRLRRGPARTAAQQAGVDGERAALFHLRRLGYVVVARRWTDPHERGEVDLVAWEGETLCFVEVKTRGSRTPFAAEFAIDRDKQATLRRMAQAYLRRMPWAHGGDGPQREDVRVRFDAVSVYLADGAPPDVRLLRDFFR